MNASQLLADSQSGDFKVGPINIIKWSSESLNYLQNLLKESKVLVVMPFRVSNMYINHLKGIERPMPSSKEFKTAIENGDSVILSPDIAASGIRYGGWDHVVLFECHHGLVQVQDSINFGTMADHVLFRCLNGRHGESWETHVIPTAEQYDSVGEALRYYTDFNSKAMGNPIEFNIIK